MFCSVFNDKKKEKGLFLCPKMRSPDGLRGERKQTQKRGFATKREAVAWKRKIAEIESKDVIA